MLRYKIRFTKNSSKKTTKLLLKWDSFLMCRMYKYSATSGWYGEILYEAPCYSARLYINEDCNNWLRVWQLVCCKEKLLHQSTYPYIQMAFKSLHLIPIGHLLIFFYSFVFVRNLHFICFIGNHIINNIINQSISNEYLYKYFACEA